MDVFLGVDELLRAHKRSNKPASEFNEEILSSIGALLSISGPRFHAAVTSLERKNFQDLRTASGRLVEFVDINPLNREDSFTLVQNFVNESKSNWPEDSISKQYIEFAIGASLGHPRTLEFIAYLIRHKKTVTAADVLNVLAEHFETEAVLNDFSFDQVADLLKLAVQAAALGKLPTENSGKVHVTDKFDVLADDLIKYGVLMDPVRSLDESTLTTFSPGFFIYCMKKLAKSDNEEHQDLVNALRQIFDDDKVERQATDRGYIFEGFHLGFLALQMWALGDGEKSLADVFQHVPRLIKYHKEELKEVEFVNKTPMKILQAPSEVDFVTTGKNSFKTGSKNLALHHRPMERGADISLWSKTKSGKPLVVAYECKYRIDDGTSGPTEIQVKSKTDDFREHVSDEDDMDFVHIFAVRNRMTPKTHDIISTTNDKVIPTFSLDEDDLIGLYKNMNMSPILSLTKNHER